MRKNFGSKLVKNAIIAAMTIMLAVSPAMSVMAQETDVATVAETEDVDQAATVKDALDRVYEHFDGVKTAYDILADTASEEQKAHMTVNDALNTIGTEYDQIEELVDRTVTDKDTINGKESLNSYQNTASDSLNTVNTDQVKADNEEITSDEVKKAFEEDTYTQESLAELVKKAEKNVKVTQEATDGAKASIAEADSIIKYYNAIRVVFGEPLPADASNATQEKLENIEKAFPGLIEVDKTNGSLENTGVVYWPISWKDIDEYTNYINEQKAALEAIKPSLSENYQKTIDIFLDGKTFDKIVSYYKKLADLETLADSAEKLVKQQEITELYNEINTLVIDSKTAFDSLADDMNSEITQQVEKANSSLAEVNDEEAKELLEKAADITAEFESAYESFDSKATDALTENTKEVAAALDEVKDAKESIDAALEAVTAASTSADRETVSTATETAQTAVTQATQAQAKAEEAYENAKSELDALLQEYEAYKQAAQDMNRSAGELSQKSQEVVDKISDAAAAVEKAAVVKAAADAGASMAEAIKTSADTLDAATQKVEAAEAVKADAETAIKNLTALQSKLDSESEYFKDLEAKIAAAQERKTQAEADLAEAQALSAAALEAYQNVMTKADEYYESLNNAESNTTTNTESNASSTDTSSDDTASTTATATARRTSTVEVIELTSLNAEGIIIDEATPLASGVDDALGGAAKAYILDCTDKQYNISETFINELKAAGYTQIIAIHNKGIASVYTLSDITGAIVVKINPVDVASIGEGFRALKIESGNAFAAVSHVMLDADVVYVFNYDAATGAYVSAGVATSAEGVQAMITGNNTLLLY